LATYLCQDPLAFGHAIDGLEATAVPRFYGSDTFLIELTDQLRDGVAGSPSSRFRGIGVALAICYC
jgi:hypothetical protein